MARKTVEQLGVESIDICAYFKVGSVEASDHLAGDEAACVCCGCPIVNVFMSNAGPLGGDCAATLTGDDSTRAAVIRFAKKAKGATSIVTIGDRLIARGDGAWESRCLLAFDVKLIPALQRAREQKVAILGASLALILGVPFGAA